MILQVSLAPFIPVSHNSFRILVEYVLMYFKCKICFTVYTGETKINDTYLLTYLLTYLII